MREDVRLRVMQAAEHILESGATVRACAAKYGVSKTTIHKDMRERLPRLDGELSKEVDAVLKKNLEERHIRGGAATREKFRRSKPPPIQGKQKSCRRTLSFCGSSGFSQKKDGSPFHLISRRSAPLY